MSATSEPPNGPRLSVACVLITLGLGGLGQLGAEPLRAGSRMQFATERIQQTVPASQQDPKGVSIVSVAAPQPPRRAAGPPSEKKRCGRLARGEALVGQVKTSLTTLDCLTGSYLTKANLTWCSNGGNR